MYRRPDRRIFRRRRNWGGAAVAAIVILAAVAVVWFATSDLFSGGTGPSAPHGTKAENPVVAQPNSAPPSPSPSRLLPTGRTTEAVTDRASFTSALAARSAVLTDGDGNVLFSLHEDEKSYPASTTKVLTALVALENGNLDDKVRVGDEANLIQPGSSVAGLRYGETLTFRQLLNALLIPSGNDAAYVIAAYIGRKTSNDPALDYRDAVNEFVSLMNERAGELGAERSHFANPDGYPDENHYTTAADMARIAREAMRNGEFRKIVATKQYKLPDIQVTDKDGNKKKKSRVLDNTNNLLYDSKPCFLDSCTGVKTGHTDDAGYCLVSSAEENGRAVFAVVLGSTEEGVWEDSRTLLQWGLRQ
jgi:D-alanyl-D-alanine carboxypeptidase (penicillin-binding protein 5/6)